MQPREYDIMYELEETYWWHTGMMAIMEQMLSPTFTADCRLLDVGSGTGAKMKALRNYCRTWGIDIHPRAVELAKRRGLENVQQGDAGKLPFDDGTFSHVICCEVLQNLDDDAAAASEAFRVLAPGGWYYISEQAYPILRGQHDISQEAVRRYTRRRLREILTCAGFVIVRMTGANTVLFPMLAAWRLASRALHPPQKVSPEESRSDLRPLPATVNGLLRSVLEAERVWLGKANLPFGLTIITLARKPE